MKIGEIAQLTETPASTIRYYEQMGLLPLPARKNGQRDYSEEIIPYLKLIRLAKNTGFHLEEIDELLQKLNDENPIDEFWQAALQSKINELNEIIQSYISMKDVLEKVKECGCVPIKDLVSSGS